MESEPQIEESNGSDDLLSLLSGIEKKLLRSQIAAEFRREQRNKQGLGTRIPKLTPRSAARYISQVSRAVQLGHLTPKQAGSMLYAAQLMIALTKLETGDLRQPGSTRNTHERRTLEASSG